MKEQHEIEIDTLQEAHEKEIQEVKEDSKQVKVVGYIIFTSSQDFLEFLPWYYICSDVYNIFKMSNPSIV